MLVCSTSFLCCCREQLLLRFLSQCLAPLSSDTCCLLLKAKHPSGRSFLWSRYFVGHLVFLVGSYVDGLYNIIRERRNLYGNESAYQCATRIRDSIVDPAERKAVNTFQWSRSVLVLKCPAAAEDVHRLEADSKFFRSLIVVSVLGSVAFFSRHKTLEGIIALALVVTVFSALLRTTS